MDPLQRLIAIEDIRQLAARYAHFRDGLHLDALVDLFAPDAVCEFGEKFGGAVIGADAIRRHFAKSMTAYGEGLRYGTLHVTTTHHIEIESADRASGRCFLVDFITTDRTQPLKFLIVYDDAYTRIDGAWKFARRTLELIWPENHGTQRLAGQP